MNNAVALTMVLETLKGQWLELTKQANEQQIENITTFATVGVESNGQATKQLDELNTGQYFIMGKMRAYAETWELVKAGIESLLSNQTEDRAKGEASCLLCKERVRDRDGVWVKEIVFWREHVPMCVECVRIIHRMYEGVAPWALWRSWSSRQQEGSPT